MTPHDPSWPASNLLETGLVSSCSCRHTWPCKVPMGQRWAHHKLLLTGSPVVLRNNKCMQSQPAYTYHTIRSTMDPYTYIYYIYIIIYRLYIQREREREWFYIICNYMYVYIHISIYSITDIFFCLKFLHKTKSDSLRPCVFQVDQTSTTDRSFSLSSF